MSKKKAEEKCCSSNSDVLGCCHVEGIAQMDRKGQIVLPKSLRDEMGLQEKDKLIVIGMRDKGKIASISLIKANKMDNMVKIMLKPVMKEILGE
ncbi:MAG: AbrB/MazE/SpoVT family DNA-binding domain-containing protein [Candidatus Heimdallarchaeota archaeon]|nr:AbrB/MazE/SpoVT family DNA-binding domain-containing protein [Candidatus Heimdallarchaeota archaeon]